MKRDWIRTECGMERGYRLVCQERGLGCHGQSNYTYDPTSLAAFNTYNGWTFDGFWRCPICSNNQEGVGDAVR